MNKIGAESRPVMNLTFWGGPCPPTSYAYGIITNLNMSIKAPYLKEGHI